MAADTATELVVPDSVTVPGSAIVEVLALLEAYEAVCADLVPDRIDGLERLENLDRESTALRGALIEGRWEDDAAYDFAYEVTQKRTKALKKAIRRVIGRPDMFLLAKVSRQVTSLAENVVGVPWDDDAQRWVYAPPKKGNRA